MTLQILDAHNKSDTHTHIITELIKYNLKKSWLFFQPGTG